MAEYRISAQPKGRAIVQEVITAPNKEAAERKAASLGARYGTVKSSVAFIRFVDNG